MSDIFNRLAQGPAGASGPVQRPDTWSQMVGAAPSAHVRQATTDAFRQVDPQEYANHTQPGVGGTDPFGQLPPQQRGGLLGAIVGALTGAGQSPQQITQGTGLNTLTPTTPSAAEVAAAAQYGQRHAPEAMGQVAAQYQHQPDVLQSLLGNKVLDMAVIGLGAKYLSDHATHHPSGTTRSG